MTDHSLFRPELTEADVWAGCELAARYDCVVSIEREDRIFEGDEELVKRGCYLSRDVLKPFIHSNRAFFSSITLCHSLERGEFIEESLMKKYIGCDLGGTNICAAIADVENGSILYQMSIPTLARDGREAVMKRMAGLFLQMIEWAGMKKEDIGGISIGVPGVLDLEKGETIFLPNLPGT